MFTVQYKKSGNLSWTTLGSYGSEQSALRNAERVASTYAFVRVLDPDQDVIWSG